MGALGLTGWMTAIGQAAGGGDPARPWTFAFITITFMAYLYIGWRSRVRETQGFYVAGHGVPAIANGAATAADWMSAASFIGMAGIVSFMGSDGSVYLMGWTGGYVLLALLLAPYLRKFGKYTVPDFVGERYESEAARIVAAICAIFVSVTYVAGQMKGVGVVFSRFLEVDLTWGVVIGMVIVAFFAVLGGMKGITWTQVAQYFILIVAFLVPAFAISRVLTGNPVPQLAFTFSELADDLNRELGSLGYDEAYTQPFTGGRRMIDVICITAALMFGTAGLPHVIVRFYTVKTVRAARWSAFWALLFIAILYTTAPAVGMFARYNLIRSLNGATVRAVELETTPLEGVAPDPEVIPIATMSAAERAAAYDRIAAQIAEPAPGVASHAAYYQLVDPQGNAINWARKWQETGLLVFDDRDRNGQITLTIRDDAGNTLESEAVTIDRDIIVLSTPEVAGLAPWVIALVAAGGLAAALSTAAGLLLVISSSIAHDLIVHFYTRLTGNHLAESRRVTIGRVAIIFGILVAGYFGINPPGFVAQVVAFAFGLAAASFFPAIFLGIFDSRTNRAGAVTGMVIGLAFTFSYIVGNQWDVMFKIARPEGYIAPWYMTPWCYGIPATGIGAVGMVVSFVVTFAVSRLTPPPSQRVRDLVESVRVPAGAHEPEAHFDETDAEAEDA